ncbi:hypothetical protein [Luteimonas saliphila]|uniref:hypothetical protein n=1 Tax=Luteimonas saliphila TaxID=2804919 RepID=UPI00192D47B3|nr:hypothetical protein [Luteimonas saliphila]
MNRKLRNTILAFSVTGMALAVGLLAAQPVLPDDAGRAGAVVQAAASASTHNAPLIPLAALGATADPVAGTPPASLHGRDPRYRAALVDAESLERVIAATVGFVAAVATEAVLADDETGAAAAGSEEAPARTRRSGSVRSGSVRSAIAVPYFSFAGGTGRGGRS